MEFLKDLLAAVGGAVGAVLIVLVFFKGILQKWINTTMEKAAEKSLAKYSNSLERKTKAYEMLLEKEFGFYQRVSEFSTELFKGLIEFSFCVDAVNNKIPTMSIEDVEKEWISVNEIAEEFILNLQMNSVYIPTEIEVAAHEVVSVLSDFGLITLPILESIKKEEFADKTPLDEARDQINKRYALLMKSIQVRLVELSE